MWASVPRLNSNSEGPCPSAYVRVILDAFRVSFAICRTKRLRTAGRLESFAKTGCCVTSLKGCLG